MIHLFARRPFLGGIAFGLAHALLLLFAFPPIAFGVLGVLAPLPLLFAGLTADRPWRTGLGVATGCLPFWAFHHWWIFAVSAAGAPPLIILQSLWAGLFVAIGSWLARRRPTLITALALAVLWSGIEFFRARVFFDGYPWFLTAHPTIDLPLAKWASVIGVYGIGFLIALLGALCLRALLDPKAGLQRWLAPAVCFTVLALGGVLPAPGSTGAFTVAVVQTNLPQSNKMSRSLDEGMQDFEEWGLLTLGISESEPEPDLVVWPETMFPGATLSPQAIREFASYEQRAGFPPDHKSGGTLFVDPLLMIQEQIQTPLLIGAIGFDELRIKLPETGEPQFEFDGKFNSVFLVSDGAIQTDRYDKMFLTPFGETMPYISNFPALEQAMLNLAAKGMQFDLNAGTRPIRFTVESKDGRTIRVATPICFEATISQVCRKLVFEHAERKADVLINMTNDGWFGSFDAGRANHLLIARWRAIELGTPVVRAANTGISCVVDASGDVRSSLEARQPATVLLAEVPLPTREGTIYARVGDLAGWLAFAGSVAILIAAPIRRLLPRRTLSTSEPPTSSETE
ncbi:MAG: apolipoprotein N-acyltransferase [Phycisphaerales bacterium JB050]